MVKLAEEYKLTTVSVMQGEEQLLKFEEMNKESLGKTYNLKPTKEILKIVKPNQLIQARFSQPLDVTFEFGDEKSINEQYVLMYDYIYDQLIDTYGDDIMSAYLWTVNIDGSLSVPSLMLLINGEVISQKDLIEKFKTFDLYYESN